ncbi:hypothetical protein KO481_38600 [Nocardia sp. NEAU-G5]|uniref:DUF3137 domain-containing protein n=1 Tax=Nocardia albiluteola TaxID=2842303 RepID=A0ABS6BD63_9NOCA|nr:DUF6585 family protein [Nocardia albiluteola]MBU3067421.1 hypothetical protein [Nocardia albiluteola]
MSSAGQDDQGALEAAGAAAEREGLGRYRGTYRAAGVDARRPIVEGAVTGVGVVAAVPGFVFGAAEVGIIGTTVAVVCGARCLADLGWLGFAGARNRGTRLDLYERGCVAGYRGQLRAVRYDSTTLRRKVVHAVKNPAAHQISYQYTISDIDDVPIVLRQGIERPEEWTLAIEQGILDAQLPRAEAALAAGERVEFDSLWLSATEIGSGSESVPWARVSELSVVGGWLSVKVRDCSQPLESLPISLVPNYVVFRTLAERLQATAAR